MINNLGEIFNLFNASSVLEYEEDPVFLEWYSIEGFDRINEISRQLQTFLNYKSALILFRFSRSQKGNNIIKRDVLIKYGDDLFLTYSRYSTFLKRVGIGEGTIAEKIRILIEKVRIQPNYLEINLLKEIKHLGGELWKIIHILSVFEFNSHSRVFHMVIKIACVLCSVEGVFFSLFSNFYGELKRSYLQLEKEISGLLYLSEDKQFEAKKYNRKVKILE